ncbi:hypothetical protein TWF281_002851 [Arthrobotrys megalospora]
MKKLSEIRELELEEEEEVKRRERLKPIIIHLLGKREGFLEHWAPAATTTISIQPDKNDTLFLRLFKLENALNDCNLTALYNPNSTEMFYLSQNKNSKKMTMEDIDRLGDEGTIWHVVYTGVVYSPFLGPEIWYTRLPRAFWVFFGPLVRKAVGRETVPLLLITDLMDGNYLPTWKAVWERPRYPIASPAMVIWQVRVDIE